jgi:hypothetical protein
VTVDRQVFEEEADRILRAADGEGVTLRLLGAVAFRRHCASFGHLQDRLGRKFTDIDFAGYGKQAPRIQALMRTLGYQEDTATYVESEGSRLVFGDPRTMVHVDVFLLRRARSPSCCWRRCRSSRSTRRTSSTRSCCCWSTHWATPTTRRST